MVVRYTNKIANTKGFGSFTRLLAKWKGSVYKLVWRDVLVYLLLYYLFSFIYRFALDDVQKRVFEKVSLHCSHFRTLIPISFVLGFYVSLIVSRWWGMYLSMPWPDTASILLSTHFHGTDARSRMMRCTVIRYLNLGILMTFCMIAPGVKAIYPGLEHFVEAGYLTESEKETLDRLERKSSQHKTYLPFLWACKVVERGRREGKVKDEISQKSLTDEILRLRGCCGELLGWDDYNIPLVYTQVVTIAVYSFFLFSVLGEQFLDPAQNYPNNLIDLYVPIFSLLQFVFYIGWLKVAESLINPFGEDEHDFEFTALIGRHLEMSYMLGDCGEAGFPTMVSEAYWDATLAAQNEASQFNQPGFSLANQFAVDSNSVA
ncbi:hypothetical protein Pcinc_004388 [Petrolisthes cinctipes]|uniref:Bestrophin homolog n=1 Tax=Petrolisthes cinctipes TaxID=88211 RepID=A0AAE1L0C4_PETCI|nr:hypothetical protein Pcinc_004388 [Petrolisthes cinctipes]